MSLIEVKKQTQLLEDISRTLKRMEAALSTIGPAAKLEFYTTIDGQRKKVVQMFLLASQKLPLSIEAKDQFGNAAQLDGAPVWAVTDEAVGKLEVAEDGLSAVFTPTGVAAATVVQVTCDADLGDGVRELLGTLDIEVISGEAVVVGIVPGNPEPL